MKTAFLRLSLALFLSIGATGLTGCGNWWKKEPEATGAVDPEPKPADPEPDKPDPPQPEPLVDPKPEPPPADDRGKIPTARAVPGKPGYVFSPFNNNVIDVKGFPSGRLVADPQYPVSEKKFFRVP
ncbi:hypothetical protein [Luteolibacter marinus]|uniref:hypothetical protein n=1 Tax=Luteolibacter marinus TaxID=2776705 RepID=UPI0018686613|nr:hypothetical protein [Luteolibacter marinus]